MATPLIPSKSSLNGRSQLRAQTPDPSCLETVLDHPFKTQIEDASVFIYAYNTTKGQPDFMGSGVIVANSGANGEPNKILTAKHVTMHNGTVLLVFDSRKHFLGRGKVEMRSAPEDNLKVDLEIMQTGDADFAVFKEAMNKDLAVISLQFVGPDAQRNYEIYKKKQGLPLASSRPDSMSIIRWDEASTGATHGLSGAPVVNDKGEVVGVFSHGSINSLPYDWKDWTSADIWKARTDRINNINTTGTPVGAYMGDNSPVYSQATFQDFPRDRIGGVSPVVDPVILGALGKAGAGNVTPMTKADSTHVTAAGYSQGYCAAFKGSMRLE
jgi:hypothetical protein